MNTKTATLSRTPKPLLPAPMRSGSTDPVPMEPSILGRAAELLTHIGNLEHEHALLRGNLFANGEANAPRQAEPSSLEGMLADACSRTACMVGDMATINGKVAR